MKGQQDRTLHRKGLIIGGKEIEVDVVIMATGFDAVTGNYLKIETIGRGRCGAEPTSGRTAPHLCRHDNVMVSELLMVFGPFSPFTSQPLVHEWQVNYSQTSSRRPKSRAASSIPSRRPSTRGSRSDQDGLAGTLFQVTDSWINGANIPGKPRTSMWYMGGMANYMVELNKIRDAGYTGFKIAERATGAGRRARSLS